MSELLITNIRVKNIIIKHVCPQFNEITTNVYLKYKFDNTNICEQKFAHFTLMLYPDKVCITNSII